MHISVIFNAIKSEPCSWTIIIIILIITWPFIWTKKTSCHYIITLFLQNIYYWLGSSIYFNLFFTYFTKIYPNIVRNNFSGLLSFNWAKMIKIEVKNSYTIKKVWKCSQNIALSGEFAFQYSHEIYWMTFFFFLLSLFCSTEFTFFIINLI